LLSSKYDGIVLVTAHKEFKEISLDKFKEVCLGKPVFYDIKNMFESDEIEDKGFLYKGL
jgi:UDP-N-acetyl-D-mannosaminuronate dehydrogenase